MRISRAFGLLVLGVVVALSSGCNNKLKDENASLTAEIGDLRAALDQRNEALDIANRDLRESKLEVARLERELAGAQSAGPRSGFDGIEGVTTSYGAGEITASVPSDVLFDSGQATLKTNAKRSLDAVAAVLNSDYSGKSIRIEGHTDTDPIRKSGHKSNYHLGFERAYAVREYLISRGVDAKRIYLASFGPDQPMQSKAGSRRVEITVLLQG